MKPLNYIVLINTRYAQAYKASVTEKNKEISYAERAGFSKAGFSLNRKERNRDAMNAKEFSLWQVLRGELSVSPSCSG